MNLISVQRSLNRYLSWRTSGARDLIRKEFIFLLLLLSNGMAIFIRYFVEIYLSNCISLEEFDYLFSIALFFCRKILLQGISTDFYLFQRD